MQYLIAVFSLLVLSFADANPIRDEPKFCNGLECPHFKTINTTDKYETRCYPTAYKWVSTVVAGREFVLLSALPQYVARMQFSPEFQSVTCCHAQRVLGGRATRNVTNRWRETTTMTTPLPSGVFRKVSVGIPGAPLEFSNPYPVSDPKKAHICYPVSD